MGFPACGAANPSGAKVSSKAYDDGPTGDHLVDEGVVNDHRTTGRDFEYLGARRGRMFAANEAEHGESEVESMTVQGLSGRLDVADIEAGIAPHAKALTACYTKHVRSRRYVAGTAELGYIVGRDGSVKRAYVKESDLGAWAVETCLVDVAHSMTFQKPHGLGNATFFVPLAFSSGRGEIRWLTEQQAAREVTPYLNTLSECAVEMGHRFRGDVRITLYAGARGKVKSVGFASNVPLEDSWFSCAEQRVLAWKLSEPKGRIAKLAFLYRPR